MALTPEEVINKRFQATKFKEGYNPEEVDDFLDEIVIELRRLNAENSSLKRQLEDAESRLENAEFTASANSNSSAAEPVQPVAAPVAQPAPAQVTDPSTSSAASLLAMAQKVHDDYVLEGQREKDRLLSEGREEVASLLSSAQEERARVLGDLDVTKSSLESSVAQLRMFEQQYRSGLRSFITEQLEDLKTSPSVEDQIARSHR